MKKASKILYLIGAILAVVVFVVLMIWGVTTLATDSKELWQAYLQMIAEQRAAGVKEAEFQTFAEFQAAKQTVGIVFCVLAGIEALVACFGFFGFAANLRPGKHQGIHIAAIVIGALSGDVLLLLGGIFGTVAGNQQQ